ncbi:MAG: MopE-related protein, partial [Myxococcota bacterium]
MLRWLLATVALGAGCHRANPGYDPERNGEHDGEGDGGAVRRDGAAGAVGDDAAVDGAADAFVPTCIATGVEACDGIDNDCDGTIDEDFGGCAACCDSADDADLCADDALTCFGCVEIGGTIAEACNGVDDDCDGAVDDGFTLCAACCDSA